MTRNKILALFANIYLDQTGLWKVEYCSRSHGSMSITLALVTLLLGTDWVGEEGGREPGGRAKNLHGTCAKNLVLMIFWQSLPAERQSQRGRGGSWQGHLASFCIESRQGA